MENTDQEPIIFKMETNSNINAIINTEEIKQVKKSRGRPTRTEQETTQAQEATKPKKAREQKTTNIKLDDEEQQLLNIQSKLNNLKEAEQEHNEALKQFKEAEQKHDKTLKQFKEAGKEYNEALKQFKPKRKAKKEAEQEAEQQL
jgi:ankyrin repeat protein